MGRDGKRYVVVGANGGGYFGSPSSDDVRLPAEVAHRGPQFRSNLLLSMSVSTCFNSLAASSGSRRRCRTRS